MAQFARPFADSTRGLWTDLNLAIVGLFSQINESSANDATYIQSALTPVASPMVVQLGYLDDPLASTGHIVRYRFRKDVDLGDQIDLTVELRQGYINEGTPGILIHSQANVAIGGTAWIAGTFTLSSTEADSITNYRDLFIRFVANKV